MDNFEQIRATCVSAGYKLTLQDPFVACVELSLAQGRRHQGIFLSELAGRRRPQLPARQHRIAPITGIDARARWRSTGKAAWATWPSANSMACPTCNCARTAPTTGWTAAEIDRLVLEIGGLGDEMERAMSAGGDLLYPIHRAFPWKRPASAGLFLAS
jgi:hypothetical protein